MNNARPFREFVAMERQVAEQISYQDTSYLEMHSKRLYHTYAFCADLLGTDSKKLVSFGAGSAYVEHALAKWHNARVTIIDFPETVSFLVPFYEQCGFDIIAADLTGEIKRSDFGITKYAGSIGDDVRLIISAPFERQGD